MHQYLLSFMSNNNNEHVMIKNKKSNVLLEYEVKYLYYKHI